jgi:hypothetical protein
MSSAVALRIQGKARTVSMVIDATATRMVPVGRHHRLQVAPVIVSEQCGDCVVVSWPLDLESRSSTYLPRELLAERQQSFSLQMLIELTPSAKYPMTSLYIAQSCGTSVRSSF